MPDEMQAEVDRRRPSTQSRASYVREAIAARLVAEDDGSWEESLKQAQKYLPDEHEPTADA